MASPADLVEDALNMNGASLNHHHIELVRQYSNTPAINVDKHKVLQILVNMIRNAKHACDETKRTDKRLTVAVGLADDRRVRISVIDNGIGISAENQPRIFNHGFTTRRDGHGFGLHSGALAAKEMGGCMTMHSDGMGLGATFTLELPLQPPRGAHAKPAGRANLDRAPSPGPNGNGHLVAAGRERPSLTAESRGSLTPNIKCHALLV
jgi:signal transduction histidine kinase